MAVVLAFDDFEIDGARSELRRGGRPLKVDALVIDLLAHLASRRGELVTHEELIKHVWGGRAVSDNVVSVCVAKLRKALGHRRGERELILNVYGRGYRFLPTVRELSRVSEPPPLAIIDTHAGAPFVGRDAIMARLGGVLSSARERHGAICALIGEPGIGKTRIAEALEERAASSGARVAWGRARELEGAPPFWPWAELLRAVLGATSNDLVAGTLGQGFADLARVLPELRAGSASDMPPDDAARYRTFDAIARLLAVAGEREPWLLVLDDMHRADAASLELLCYLVDEIARLPVAIVVTLRSTEPRRSPAEQRHIDYVLGHRNCERIEVAPLSERDVAQCTEALLGRRDDALSHAVFQKSEGNAFFVTELLREIGAAHDSGGRELPPFPPAALDLVRQRVRRVGDEALSFLKIAAVLGRSFELGLLSRVAQAQPSALLECFDHALATDLIVAAPDGISRFAFGHDLIRAVLYDGLSKREVAALHLRVAEVLEELARDGREVAPAELAHHYLRALPHGDPVRAAKRGERAAEAAMNVAAYADAALLLRRSEAALDLAVEPAPHLRCRLHYKLSVCLRVSDARASIVELRKAVALARNTSFYRLLALAGQAMVRAPGVVMMEDGRAALEDALEGLADNDHELRSTVLSHLAWCAPYCFDREKTAELGARALEHARTAGSRPALITALRTQIHFGGGPCRPIEETKRLLDEADQLAVAEDHAVRVTWRNQASTLRATFALQRGDRVGLDRALDVMARSTRELQHAELIWHSDRVRIIDRMNRGELRDVEPLLRELRARAKSMQLFAGEMVCAHDFMVLARETVGLHGSGSSWTVAPAAPQDSPSVLAIKLRVGVDLGRADLVQAMFDHFVSRGITRLPCDRDHLGVLGHLARAAILLDDAPNAELILALLEPHTELFASDLSFHCDGSVAHIVGLLARHLGKRDAAIEHLRNAVRHNDRFGLRARAAQSRFDLACTLLSGSPQEQSLARDLLAGAAMSAHALGMAQLVAQIARVLGVPVPTFSGAPLSG